MKWLNKTSVVTITLGCLAALFGAVALIRLTESAADHYGRTTTGYGVLAKPAPPDYAGPIELVDFFYYGCPHCNDFEAPLDAWISHEGTRVHVRRVPVGSDDIRVRQAHLYYALSSMGLAEHFQPLIYAEVHQRGNALDSDAKILAWIRSQGIDVVTFMRAYQSESVETERQAGIVELKRDQITSVPTVVIGTRWVVSPTTAGGLGAALDVMTERVGASTKFAGPVASR